MDNEQITNEQQIQAASFIDASIFNDQESLEAMKEDVKMNRIGFDFPEDLNQVDLQEECRALKKLDDFDTMYDLTMQMLEGKPFIVSIKNYDGSKSILTEVHVTDRYMNLRGDEVINQYPVIVVWLTEFIGARISKKFPVPMQSQPQTQKAPMKKVKEQKAAQVTTS